MWAVVGKLPVVQANLEFCRRAWSFAGDLAGKLGVFVGEH